MNTIALGLSALSILGVNAFDQDKDWSTATSIYQFQANDLQGNLVSLEKYKGHPLIVVNAASKCKLTKPNYQQLQQLYEKYGADPDSGLRILAFPSSDFANQEPGSPEEIQKFVKDLGVTFDMFEKIHVNGDHAHPLWKWLKQEQKGTLTDDIKWNFTKFIISKDGKAVDRFAPTTEPLSMEDDLKKYL